MTGDRPSSQMFVGGRARLWDHWKRALCSTYRLWCASRGAPARLVGRQAAGVRVPRRGVRGGPALETAEAVRRPRGETAGRRGAGPAGARVDGSWAWRRGGDQPAGGVTLLPGWTTGHILSPTDKVPGFMSACLKFRARMKECVSGHVSGTIDAVPSALWECPCCAAGRPVTPGSFVQAPTPGDSPMFTDGVVGG